MDVNAERLRLERECIEMEEYLIEVERRERRLQAVIGSIQEHWLKAFDSSNCPAERIVRSWLTAYPPEVVTQGIDILSYKVINGWVRDPCEGGRTFQDALRYCSACMRNIVREKAMPSTSLGSAEASPRPSLGTEEASHES